MSQIERLLAQPERDASCSRSWRMRVYAGARNEKHSFHMSYNLIV
jgi:hypothetical protein